MSVNKSIKQAIAASDRADEKLKAAVLRECCACEHQHLAEMDDSPPWRVCLDCGLTEEGWGCGYELLRAPLERIGSIGRDQTLRIRTASLWQRDYGEPIEQRIRKFLNIAAAPTEQK